MQGLYPERTARKIDYAMMNREYPKLKSALTRAQNKRDPFLIVRACERFVKVSDAVGCMPDDWARWRNALEDAWDMVQRSSAYQDEVFDYSDLIAQFRAVAVRFDF